MATKNKKVQENKKRQTPLNKDHLISSKIAVITPPTPKKNSKSKYKNSIRFVHNDKRTSKKENNPAVIKERIRIP